MGYPSKSVGWLIVWDITGNVSEQGMTFGSNVYEAGFDRNKMAVFSWAIYLIIAS